MSEAASCHARVALTAARLFYGVPEFFLMKALLDAPLREECDCTKHPVLQLDDTLAARLRLPTKYTRLLLARLHADRLIVCHLPKAAAAEDEADSSTAASSTMPTQRDMAKYWGLDFEALGDAVRYKMHAMGRRLTEARCEPAVRSFFCPRCLQRTSALDLDYNRLANPVTGHLSCPSGAAACMGVELVVDDPANTVAMTQVHCTALQAHLTPLVDALRDAHELQPPTYKRARPTDEVAEAAAARARHESGGRSAPRGGGGNGSSNTLGASSGVAAAMGSGASGAVPDWIAPRSSGQRPPGEVAAASPTGVAPPTACGTGGPCVEHFGESMAAFEQAYLVNYIAEHPALVRPAPTVPYVRDSSAGGFTGSGGVITHTAPASESPWQAAGVAPVARRPQQQHEQAQHTGPGDAERDAEALRGVSVFSGQSGARPAAVKVTVAGVNMDIDEVAEDDARRMTRAEFACFSQIMQERS